MHVDYYQEKKDKEFIENLKSSLSLSDDELLANLKKENQSSRIEYTKKNIGKYRQRLAVILETAEFHAELRRESRASRRISPKLKDFRVK